MQYGGGGEGVRKACRGTGSFTFSVVLVYIAGKGLRHAQCKQKAMPQGGKEVEARAYHIPELVLDDGDLLPVGRRQDVVQQGRLAAAEEAREHGDRHARVLGGRGSSSSSGHGEGEVSQVGIGASRISQVGIAHSVGRNASSAVQKPRFPRQKEEGEVSRR